MERQWGWKKNEMNFFRVGAMAMGTFGEFSTLHLIWLTGCGRVQEIDIRECPGPGMPTAFQCVCVCVCVPVCSSALICLSPGRGFCIQVHPSQVLLCTLPGQPLLIRQLPMPFCPAELPCWWWWCHLLRCHWNCSALQGQTLRIRDVQRQTNTLCLSRYFFVVRHG